MVRGIEVFPIDADGTWQAAIGDKRLLVDVHSGTATIDEGPCTSGLEYVRREDDLVLYDGDIPLYPLPRFQREGKYHWFDNVLEKLRLRIDEDDRVFIEPVEISDKPYKKKSFPK
ncbi:MAG: hypothetical protein D6790_20305 [Caldilineae bacterium]|nr:MAG: hypothetical protein D6790_20305 [Caldilineae bacterium]